MHSNPTCSWWEWECRGQELWILDNLESISANAIITCGATMDYFTGEIASPPGWAGPLGLYGLTRLLSEPRRLWKRYLIEPWVVLAFSSAI